MERAYYIVGSGPIREKAIEIQNQIEKEHEVAKVRMKVLHEEFGCSEFEYYRNNNNNKVVALVFPDKKPNVNTWKRVDKTNGWMPKRNSKTGKALYAKVVGDVPELNTNDAIPRLKCFDWKCTGMKMLITTCHVLPFHVLGEEDEIYVSVPFDEMETEGPIDISEDVMEHFERITPLKYQKAINRFNDLSESQSKEKADA